MVEINLSSNEGILGITGNKHPFQYYRAAHVPVALSTDDQGVSRIDLTHEYVRAANDYHLSYAGPEAAWRGQEWSTTSCRARACGQRRIVFSAAAARVQGADPRWSETICCVQELS